MENQLIELGQIISSAINQLGFISAIEYAPDPYKSINWTKSAGEFNYEVRFTPQCSQFYYSKYRGINPHLKNDSLSSSRVPFEIWRSDQWGNQERMFIKIVDSNLTTNWDFEPTGV